MGSRLTRSERRMVEMDVSTPKEREILEELRRRRYGMFERIFQTERGDFLYAVMRRRQHGSGICCIAGTSIDWAKSEVKRLRKEEAEKCAADVAANWSCGFGL